MPIRLSHWINVISVMALFLTGEYIAHPQLAPLVGWVLPFCGGSFRTHMWHHMFSWAFIVFAVIHLCVVLFDSHQYRNGLISSIVSGHKFYEEGDLDHDTWLS